MSDELTIVPQDNFIGPVVSVANALAAYQAKKDLIDQILKQDVDFGTIPGSAKPALLKAGAEKMTSFFGLSTRFTDAEKVEDWTGKEHGEPFFYYRESCSLYRGDRLIASADGSCNSWEKKYHYRWVGESEIPANMSKDGLVARDGKANEFDFAITKGETSGKYGKPAEYWKKFRDEIAAGTATKILRTTSTGKKMDAWEIGAQLYRIPNDEIADLVNTILKMAQKRALVAATLIATGLSDYFTQDIDDFVAPGTTVIEATAKPVQPPEPMPYEQAAAMIAKSTKEGGEDKRFDALTQPQLEYIVMHSKDSEKVEAALTVLEKDFGMMRPGTA
jgi:hypothetical protein